MENLILFDQDTLHYRQSIYRHFRKVFAGMGYNLLVVYDNKQNTISEDTDFFIGTDYSFRNCVAQLNKYKPRIILQFIWLKYTFLFPFMIYCKFRGIKTILWSHGINLQTRTKTHIKYMHYLRQLLVTAQLIYTPNELKYVVGNRKKVFVANNTLNFFDMPKIEKSKEELKAGFGLAGKKIVLCVGRLNTHKRKVGLLLDAFKMIEEESIHLIVVGTGVTEEQQVQLSNTPRCQYLGAIFDPVKINEIYKMSDLFVMPGGVGLAINHAFFHGMPILIEDVNHSPEAYYLKPGENGFIFNKGDATDLAKKIRLLLTNEELYAEFSKNALETTTTGEASFSNMTDGFVRALEYTRNK